MILNLLGLLLVVTVGFVCVVQPVPLVGAEPAKINEFPYLVSIRLDGVHVCGGAILDSNHILTAAHCFVPLIGDDLERVRVVSGSTFLDRGGEYHRVKNFWNRPFSGGGINRIWINDIAVAKLEDNITFNAAQNKIERATFLPPVGSYAMIAGWGSTVIPPGLAVPSEIQKLSLKVIGTEECQKYYDTVVLDDMICTLDKEGVGLCSGDSGSPLVYENKIVGVAFGGIACAKNFPDIFIKVASYEPFITNALRD